jgi:hypothetical protein
VRNIAGDLVADVTDKRGDRKSRDRVAPGLAERDSNQPGERARGGQRVQPGMPGVGDQRGRADALADDEL